MTNLPYIPTEYSVKPGIKKLGDENHFIIDDLLPLYKNEKQDARAENLSEYYLERDECKKWGFTEIQQANQKHLMKTASFWMAEQISKQIKTPEAKVNEENLALTLAIKLTQDENLVAAKIPPYADLLSQVTESNEQQDYEKAIDILDEDIADRTPDEQRKALKISGLMSVLVASKKLKRAISTIDDYDLPDDPGLREISAALAEWLSNNLVVE